MRGSCLSASDKAWSRQTQRQIEVSSLLAAKRFARLGDGDNVISVEGGIRVASRIAEAQEDGSIRWGELDAN